MFTRYTWLRFQASCHLRSMSRTGYSIKGIGADEEKGNEASF